MFAATIIGRLGADGELRATTGGQTVLNLRMAVDEYDGKQKVTTWIRVAFWGKRAESISQFCTKGKELGISGSCYEREYEVNGEKRKSLEMRANDIKLLGGGDREHAAQAKPQRDDDMPF